MGAVPSTQGVRKKQNTLPFLFQGAKLSKNTSLMFVTIALSAWRNQACSEVSNCKGTVSTNHAMAIVPVEGL